jgi:hypothetical protein
MVKFNVCVFGGWGGNNSMVKLSWWGAIWYSGVLNLSVSFGNWQYRNSGLVGVQIGAAMLMYVSVLKDVGLIAYNLKCWTALTVKWWQQSTVEVIVLYQPVWSDIVTEFNV